MTVLQLDQSNWVTIANYTSPSGQYGHPSFFDLTFPSDYALITVSLGIDRDWVRGGWVYQVWEKDGTDPVNVGDNRIRLEETLLFPLKQINSSVIAYRPELHIFDYHITIQARTLT